MRILIKNGRVIDPANNIDKTCDILIEAGKIKTIARDINSTNAQKISASGNIVMPGLLDMHVHLREPGRQDKETVETAKKAAARGGVTSFLAMPNTNPPIDSAEHIELLKSIIKKDPPLNVFISAAITKGRKGKELTDLIKLKSKGAMAISDDGSSVDDTALFLKALNKAKANNILVICHCEDKTLSANGVVNLGLISTKMGLRGISKESEYRRIERDIDLAKKAKCRIHITHISCKESVEIIRKAKKSGLSITADVTPHHFALTEEAVVNFDTNMKMNPPLRGRDDVEAIRNGLRDGTIDAIASDHAPHTANEKNIEFEHAEFGVIGLETELSVAATELVQTGVLDWNGLIKKTSLNPARILGVRKGTLSVGADADIAIIDPDAEWVVQKERIVSKSKNLAFIGKRLRGEVICTICNGEIVYKHAG
jgi:dihydroorotase